MTSTRKGNKKLAIFDLKVTMKWEAQAEDDTEQVCSSAWMCSPLAHAGFVQPTVSSCYLLRGQCVARFQHAGLELQQCRIQEDRVAVDHTTAVQASE